MSSRTFQDLIVWQVGRQLVIDIYAAFDKSRDFGFKDQIQRAVMSIPNNVAEGYARRSDKSFRHFLSIAKGSAAEVESMLLIALELDYVTPDQQTELLTHVRAVIKLLTVFINQL